MLTKTVSLPASPKNVSLLVPPRKISAPSSALIVRPVSSLVNSSSPLVKIMRSILVSVSPLVPILTVTPIPENTSASTPFVPPSNVSTPPAASVVKKSFTSPPIKTLSRLFPVNWFCAVAEPVIFSIPRITSGVPTPPFASARLTVTFEVNAE